MPTATAALTADGRLLERVRTGRFDGVVHSVFDSVVNVRTTEGGLATLVARHLDNAPGTVVVDVPSMAPLRAQPGARVVGRDARLVCPGRFTVDVAGARSWTAELPDLADEAEADGLARMAAELGRILDRDGRAGGIRPRREPTGTIEARVASALGEGARRLLEALATGDLDAADRWARRIVGLGPGLTPSGDDFITGLAATLAAPGTRIHALAPWAAELVAACRARTNAISWTAMHEATQGRMRESIVTVLSAVAAGDAEALRPAARKVISIGKTSGTDIVTGMQAALHLERELRGAA